MTPTPEERAAAAGHYRILPELQRVFDVDPSAAEEEREHLLATMNGERNG